MDTPGDFPMDLNGPEIWPLSWQVLDEHLSSSQNRVRSFSGLTVLLGR